MAAVWANLAGDDRPLPGIEPERWAAVLRLAASGQAPTTTSVGRLFDAVAALVGCRSEVTYEAQAAMELEALARSVDRADATHYEGTVTWSWEGDVIELDPAPLVATVRRERDRGVAAPVVAAGFHEAMGRATALAAAEVARRRGLETVALSGGVFQNVRLAAIVQEELRRGGLEVLTHRSIPPNDGGISIGQAAVAAARAAARQPG